MQIFSHRVWRTLEVKRFNLFRAETSSLQSSRSAIKGRAHELTRLNTNRYIYSKLGQRLKGRNIKEATRGGFRFNIDPQVTRGKFTYQDRINCNRPPTVWSKLRLSTYHCRTAVRRHKRRITSLVNFLSLCAKRGCELDCQLYC